MDNFRRQNNAAIDRLLTAWAREDELRNGAKRERLSDAERNRAYGQSALTAEAKKVQEAPQGDRNNQLFRSAATLAELVAGGGLAESEVVVALTEAGLAAGLEPSEVASTIQSGMRKGSTQPRTVPPPTSKPSTNGHHKGEGEKSGIDLAQLRREDVATILDLAAAGATERWLWPDWIPIGVLIGLASEPGLGKTRFCLDLVRRIRHQQPWPDGSKIEVPPESLALWVVGDNHHDQMVTHAQEYGVADGIYLNANKDNPYGGVNLDSLEDVAWLDAHIRAVRPVLVVIDTVGNTTELNLSRSEDARTYYAPLQVLARTYECAILCLTHLNASGKYLGRRVLEKVRTAIQISQPDPGDERRRLWIHKSYGKKPQPLGLTMRDGRCDYDTNPPEEGSETSKPAARGVSEAVRAAADWLKDQLGVQGKAKRVSVLRNEAEEAGIGSKTLYEAKRFLNIDEFSAEGKKWWTLPANEHEA